MIFIKEDFNDFKIGELPYDKGHTALGEYHHIDYDGYFGNFYDPIALHQWRSLDGSWLITEDNGIHYLEQNRGDNTKGAFVNVCSTLVHKQKIFSNFSLSFNVRQFEVDSYSGIAFSYLTSRYYYGVVLEFDELKLIRRNEETIDVIKSIKIKFDDSIDYKIKVDVSNNVLIYLNDELVINEKIDYVKGRNIAFISKASCRFSNLVVELSDEEYKDHLINLEKENERLEEKRSHYPKLKCIKKINLGKSGTGRQLRIARFDGKTYLLFAQHQKRYIRDSFAHLSSMSLFEYESGKLLWTIGEPNNSFDNTMISCDLPFQIADIDNDGRLEIIYARNFEVRIIDMLTKQLKASMKTPIIKGDPNVKNEPYYRLNVDAIRVADFEGLGYKGDFIIKDRYQNVWAFSYKNNFKELFRYNHKNTGHFPYVFDYDNDGKDELLIGYDLINSDGKMIWSLPMNSDHTDEIIYAKLKNKTEEKFILASGNEGMNIINRDGTIFKHNEIGHAQRISVAKYDLNREGLQIMATAFWGSDGIVCIYDYNGNLLKQMEVGGNGSVITPVMYDGTNILALLHAGINGGLVDYELDRVVEFPNDSHPFTSSEVYDIDSDGIDEILCWDLNELWVYKAEEYVSPKKEYLKYPENAFSNYRGEYLISKDDLD